MAPEVSAKPIVDRSASPAPSPEPPDQTNKKTKEAQKR